MTESNPRSAVERIAAFAAAARPEQLTNDTRRLFKRNVLDSLGCAIAALQGQPFQALREQFEEYRALGRCTLIGGGKTSADQAALFNSGLVRYVDLLDSYMAPGGLCHPSDNFGTVLAAAEQAGASGEEFILALAVAYEIQCRFSAAVPVMAKGFNHVTQLAISAAASAGKLLELSAGEIANAIAIATVDNISLACVHAEPVSQWKGFSPGMTGMRAIYAASLAKRGFEGPSGLFEGPDGLTRMFAQSIDVDWENPSLEIRRGGPPLVRAAPARTCSPRFDRAPSFRHSVSLQGHRDDRNRGITNLAGFRPSSRNPHKSVSDVQFNQIVSRAA